MLKVLLASLNHFPTSGSVLFLAAIASGLSVGQAIASEPALPTSGMEQVNSVSGISGDRSQEADTGLQAGITQVTPSLVQFLDEEPTHWAYEALKSLVDRYACIVGYPDRTFKGKRSLTRYEFAAGVNACLDRVNELLASKTADLVRKEDLLALQKLQEEFATELATLRGRVDSLEARTATLEKQQFSTTTKLVGEVILSRSDAIGGKKATGFAGAPVDAGSGFAVFQDRVRLNLQTSFTGKDLLLTRLEAGNAIPTLASGGTTGGANSAYLLFANEGRLAYDNSNVASSNNSVSLSLLSYKFPLADRATVNVFGAGASHFNYADTLNPYLGDEDGGSGALSRFGQFNPIYRIGGNGAGLGLNIRFTDAIGLDLGYLANQANNPAAGAGLFNGNYSALAQLVFRPGSKFKLGLTFVHGYDGAGSFRFGGAGTATGTFLGNLLAGAQGGGFPPNRPVSSNSYGVEASFQLSPAIVIGGWAGLTKARLIGYGDAEIWNYALTLAFPDLLKRGSVAGIIAGVEPTLRGVRSGGRQVSVPNRNESIHLEAYYKFQITDSISLTPGFIWLPSLNQRSSNEDVFIGIMRTTYSF